jgi:hypothetical protein
MPSQTLVDLYTTGSCLSGPCELHREPYKERQPYTLASEVPRGLHCTAAHILWPSYCDQVIKRGLPLNFSTYVVFGDLPGRLVPLRKRGERLLFADGPD